MTVKRGKEGKDTYRHLFMSVYECMYQYGCIDIDSHFHLDITMWTLSTKITVAASRHIFNDACIREYRGTVKYSSVSASLHGVII